MRLVAISGAGDDSTPDDEGERAIGGGVPVASALPLSTSAPVDVGRGEQECGGGGQPTARAAAAAPMAESGGHSGSPTLGGPHTPSEDSGQLPPYAPCPLRANVPATTSIEGRLRDGVLHIPQRGLTLRELVSLLLGTFHNPELWPQLGIAELGRLGFAESLLLTDGAMTRLYAWALVASVRWHRCARSLIRSSMIARGEGQPTITSHVNSYHVPPQLHQEVDCRFVALAEAPEGEKRRRRRWTPPTPSNQILVSTSFLSLPTESREPIALPLRA